MERSQEKGRRFSRACGPGCVSAAAAAVVNDKFQLLRALGTKGRIHLGAKGRIHLGAKPLPWCAGISCREGMGSAGLRAAPQLSSGVSRNAGGGRRWCLRLCLSFPWISLPAQVPEHLPARWHLLKLLHLHPGSKGCSGAVCRQVSVPSVLRDFTALQFCSGVS